MSRGDRGLPGRRPDRAALAIAVALALAAALVAWSTMTMRAPTGGQIGPKAFPYLVAVCLFGLAVWTAFSASRGEFPERETQNLPPILWIVGGLAVQMLLLKTAGFSIATGLLFAATARGFGRGPLWLTVPLGIVLAFALWIVFAGGLQLSLPAGPLERLLFP